MISIDNINTFNLKQYIEWKKGYISESSNTVTWIKQFDNSLELSKFIESIQNAPPDKLLRGKKVLWIAEDNKGLTNLIVGTTLNLTISGLRVEQTISIDHALHTRPFSPQDSNTLYVSTKSPQATVPIFQKNETRQGATPLNDFYTPSSPLHVPSTVETQAYRDELDYYGYNKHGVTQYESCNNYYACKVYEVKSQAQQDEEDYYGYNKHAVR